MPMRNSSCRSWDQQSFYVVGGFVCLSLGDGCFGAVSWILLSFSSQRHIHCDHCSVNALKILKVLTDDQFAGDVRLDALLFLWVVDHILRWRGSTTTNIGSKWARSSDLRRAARWYMHWWSAFTKSRSCSEQGQFQVFFVVVFLICSNNTLFSSVSSSVLLDLCF